MACPSCGHRPVNREEAAQQRGDLSLVWLEADEHGGFTAVHHCANCAPAGPVTDVVSCLDCEDGPLLPGRHDTIPEAVVLWLHDAGWQLDPQPLCPACLPRRSGRAALATTG